jgi:hypothetical protein
MCMMIIEQHHYIHLFICTWMYPNKLEQGVGRLPVSWVHDECLPMIIHRTPLSSLSSAPVSCNKWILEGGNLITQLIDARRWNGSEAGFRNLFFFASATGWIKSTTSISSSLSPPAIYYFGCIVSYENIIHRRA